MGAGGQCSDAGVGADEPESIHAGTENGDLRRTKGGNGLPMNVLLHVQNN